MDDFDNLQINIGNRIKKLRQEKELTQKELAGNLGVSSSTIGMYETGKRSLDNEMLDRISNYFNVSSDYLLCRTNIRNDDTNIINPQIKKIVDAFESNGINLENLNEDILNKIVKTYKMFDEDK